MATDRNPPVRLVACDLDGTLLRRDRSISDRTAAAVAAAESVGVIVVLVTARPPRYVQEVAAALSCHPVVVCSNGALIWEIGSPHLLAEHLIPATVGTEAVRRLRDQLPGAVFSVEMGLRRYGCEAEYVGEWPRPEGALIASAEELVNTQVVKICVRHGRTDPWDALDRVSQMLRGLVEVTRSGPTAPIELLAVGVSKALGVTFVAERLGIQAHDALAVGDMPNDLPMLRWAGRSAAPANAHAEVLRAVDRVVGDCDADGVADLLDEVTRYATEERS